MDCTIRKAIINDIPDIWYILQKAIIRRRNDGSNQWQDGYPNPELIKNDIAKNIGYVLAEGQNIFGYFAMLINDEPEYENIKGEWLTHDDFVVIHRVAIEEKYLGQGLTNKIFAYVEEFALQNNIFSIKADTNFDNKLMLHVFKKLGYTYCGKVSFRGQERRAFEKVLKL